MDVYKSFNPTSYIVGIRFQFFYVEDLISISSEQFDNRTSMYGWRNFRQILAQGIPVASYMSTSVYVCMSPERLLVIIILCRIVCKIVCDYTYISDHRI